MLLAMPFTITELSQLRPFGIDSFRLRLAGDPEAFDMHWELAKKLTHPLFRLEMWGWMVEARRQNRRVKKD